MGRRSERLGMRRLFEEQDAEQWYREDLHLAVENYFKKVFPEDRVRVSKDEAFPAEMK